MSPRKIDANPTPKLLAALRSSAVRLGAQAHDERIRRGWNMATLAARSGISIPTLHRIEAGEVASLEAYVRVSHALGWEPEFSLERGRVPSATRDADPIHAAMGEAEAAHLSGLGFEVLLDEPYQHCQFAGRADLVGIDRTKRALLHLENRTRFPDIQAAIGSYNAKRAYLAPRLAERLGVRGGLASVTHVIVALWSAEVLHTLRLREATFRSVCPDAPSAFETWWSGSIPANNENETVSSLVIFDPVPGQRSTRRRWVGLDDLRTVEPRYRGYADAVTKLRLADAA